MFGFVITLGFFIIRKAYSISQFIALIYQFIAVFVIIGSVNFIQYLRVCDLIIIDFIFFGFSLLIGMRDWWPLFSINF